MKSEAKWFDTSKFVPYPTSSTCATTTVTGCSAATGYSVLANYPAWTGIQSMPGYSWVPVTGYTPKNGVYNDFTTRVTYNQQVFGSIRNPYTTAFTLGARKNFNIAKGVSFQLGMDAFNALNHPQFGSIDVTPTDTGFGAVSGSTLSTKWTQVNSPRTIQIRGRLTF